MRPLGELLPGSAFWREAFAIHGAATIRVLPRTLAFGLFAAVVALVHRTMPGIGIRGDAFDGAGIVLGVLLVFRSAAGYDRWWEARTLWGGIVNQSRNLVVAAAAYGPDDRSWRADVARWVATFAHVARATLRGERAVPEVVSLLGATEAARIAGTAHMPSTVAERLGTLLRDAREIHRLDGFSFLQLDRERTALLDHLGGCERILKTPIPEVYSVIIRRFIVLYLFALPFALAASVQLLTPLYVMLIAYPILSLEQIGAELQNPFVTRSLSHLDLDALTASIEAELRPVGIDTPATPGPREPSASGRS